MASITDMLMALSSADPAVRVPAEQAITQARETDLSGYIVAMLGELRDDSKPDVARYMAGTLLKNAIAPSFREVAARRALEAKWKALPADVRQKVREEVLSTLGSPTREVRSVAANIIGSLSRIELPANEWPELVNILVSAARSASTQHQEAALTALGYICEEGHDHEDVELALRPHTTEMLSVIFQCMTGSSDEQVRFCATNALCNAMEYIRDNMQQASQRDVLVDALCTTAQSSQQARTRERAMESLVKVAELYYATLPTYIARLHAITSEAIFKDDEAVGLQAIQFWISICDTEREMIEEGDTQACLQYAAQGKDFLVDTCLRLLTRQEEGQTEDDWNLAIAGGKLLQSLAETVGLPVQAPVMDFVYRHINSTQWREREAAVLAFGCLLGCSQEEAQKAIEDTVAQSVPGLLKYIVDENEMVADTSAWVLAVICEFFVDVFLKNATELRQLLNVVGPMIAGGDAHMGKRACQIVHNLALAYEGEEEDEGDTNNNNNNATGGSERGNELSPFYSDLVGALLYAIDHGTAPELKSTAQETLNALVDAAAPDCRNKFLVPLVPELHKRMAFQLGLADQGTMTEEVETMLSLLCGALSALARKLGAQFGPAADASLQLLLRLVEKYDEHVQDEALVAIGSIAYAVKQQMEPYMSRIVPYIVRCMQAVDEPESVYGVVAAVGDLCLACGPQLRPYVNSIMDTLYAELINPAVDRDLKCNFLSCFGDVILNVLGSAGFLPYMPTLLPTVEQIFNSSTTIDIRGDPDSEQYVMSLWESTASLYSSTLQSFRDNQQLDALAPYLPSMLRFALHAANQAGEYSETQMAALMVTGDMASVLRQASPQLRQQGKEALCTPALYTILEQAMKSGTTAEDKKQLTWIQNQLKQLKKA